MTPLLTATKISKHFQGVAALTDVNLEIFPGEVLGLVGPNGAGKTTFVNAITGYIPPDAGQVVLAGEDITGLPMDRVARRGVTRTFQHLHLLDQSSVLENVLLGRHQQFGVKPWTMGRRRHREEIEQREKAGVLLDELGLSDIGRVAAGSLPYGVRRRVEIARALATEPKALLLDEPTAGMTPSDTDDIGELIDQTAAGGVAVMLIEHNVSLVTKLSTRIAVLDWGSVVMVGPPDSVWADERVRAAYIGVGAR